MTRLSVVREEGAPQDAPSAATVEAIYAEHHAMVFRLGLRYGQGDVQWAQDVTHDVFVDLFADPGRLDGVENVAAWLYRVTTHRCLRHLRRERFFQSAPVRWLLETRATASVDPEVLGIEDERLRRVFRAVQAMPPKMRASFFMHHVDGKSQTEIAEILGCTKSYVCKLLAQVRTRLQSLGLGEEPA